MSIVEKLEVVHFPAVKMVGKELTCGPIMADNNPLPQHWKRCLADGSLATLESLSKHVFSQDYVGWMGDYNPETGAFNYIVGMLMEQQSPVPEGYSYRDLPACVTAIAWIKGPEFDNYDQALDLTLQTLQERGYAFDEQAGYTLEVYACERFVQPMQRGEPEVTLDYYVPCRRIKGDDNGDVLL